MSLATEEIVLHPSRDPRGKCPRAPLLVRVAVGVAWAAFVLSGAGPVRAQQTSAPHPPVPVAQLPDPGEQITGPAARVPPHSQSGVNDSGAIEPNRIDLPTVLRLAGMNDLDLASVREAEHLAKAANDAATLRFFPWISAGVGYVEQRGAAQQFGGKVLPVDEQLSQRSADLNLQVDLGNALFEKLAARRLLNAAALDTEAQQKDTLLASAIAYFDLVDAAASEDIAREAVHISQDYEQQLQRAYSVGMTNRSEVIRVSVQTQRDQVVLRQAEAGMRSASAALATLLRLDPTVELLPIERVVAPPTLVPVDVQVQALVKEALASRPELKASAATVAAADRERLAAAYGPLLPSVGGQAIYGQIRGGPSGDLSDYMSTHEYVIGLSWRLGPGGLFDFSRTEAADSRLRHQQLIDERLHDDISKEVVDAYEAARAGLDQIGLARHGVELAEESLKLSRQRKEFGVYRVLEIIQAQQDLTQARSDYARALTQYAKAQYRLAHATARIGG